MEHVVLLLLISLFFLCQAQGCPQCREQAVSAGETLRLLPEKPPQGWEKAIWRVTLDSGQQFWILTAEKNQAVQFPSGPFSGRSGFQPDTLSLWISAVGTADSGVYLAEFEDTSGSVTARCCFRVSVWEPVRSPHLEQNLLHREQGWCNLSLVCAVPGASNVSYSWTCSGDPLRDPEPRPWVYLQVRDDDNLTVCSCNASNPVSWSVASTDVTAACRAEASGISLSYCLVKGLLCLVVLGNLSAAMVGTHVLVRRRRSPSRGTPLGAGDAQAQHSPTEARRPPCPRHPLPGSIVRGRWLVGATELLEESKRRPLIRSLHRLLLPSDPRR
ncbi:natural killer cell receptor 2B4-like [Athene noctua]|uniref:natural killer cell receptor 2B4-like n=1 Tax=Athene noctua TaxID=126797 RepID=UPI003EBF1BD2